MMTGLGFPGLSDLATFIFLITACCGGSAGGYTTFLFKPEVAGSILINNRQPFFNSSNFAKNYNSKLEGVNDIFFKNIITKVFKNQKNNLTPL